MADFDNMNRTELAYIAQAEDPEAHRDLSRVQLLAIITGDSAPLPPRKTNRTRLKIMRYIDAHWVQLRPQLTCPAKSGLPRACFQCTDLQVTECLMKNKNIQLFEKKEE